MDIRRAAIQEKYELMRQYNRQQEALPIEELKNNKLIQLLAFIDRLKSTPPGAAEFRRRIKCFGECKRIEGESTGQFYGRLRHWLDRDTPQAKSPTP
jgi:hypothetical protein